MRQIFCIIAIFLISSKVYCDHHQPPFVLAIMKDDVEKVKEFIENGQDINEKVGEFKSPVIHFSVGMSTRKNVLQYLVKKGADINALDSYNSSILISAAQFSTPDVIEFLIENGANINQVNTDGNFPINAAVYGVQFDNLKLLLDKGANINQTSMNASNDTALISAVSSSKENLVRLLLERGADKYHKSGFGDALSIAKQIGNKEIIGLLTTPSVQQQSETTK